MTSVKKKIKETEQLILNNKPEIRQNNLTALTQLSFIMCIAAVILIICCLTIDSWKPVLGVSALGECISAIVFMLCMTLFKKYPYFARGASYTYFFFLLVFASYQAIGNRTYGSTSTALYLFLVLLPLLITDRPTKIIIFVGAFNVLYMILALARLPLDIAVSTSINCILVSLISTFFCMRMTYVKLCRIELDRLLDYQRNFDTLTGLPNRRKMYDAFEDLKKNVDNDYAVGVIMIDVDHFKLYNDTYGHQAGDDCLKSLADCFIEFAKNNKVDIFRYGGEEFLLLATGYGYEELSAMASELVKEVFNLKIVHEKNKQGVVTISTGYAEALSCNANTVDELISFSDAALYKAKETCRNTAIGYLEI